MVIIQIGTDLFAELKIVRETLPEGVTTPIEVLYFLKSIHDFYPSGLLVEYS